LSDEEQSWHPSGEDVPAWLLALVVVGVGAVTILCGLLAVVS